MNPTRHEPKPVFRQHGSASSLIGYARTWSEVAALIGDRRPDAAAHLSREHSEGKDGFHLKENPRGKR